MRHSNCSNFAIETVELTKSFGKLTALDGLNLKIAQGEIYGLLGPNRSGKTTTVKILCGLIRPTSGRTLVLGTEPGDSHTASKIGYMPQETALYPNLTVHENIELFGEIYGMGRAEIADGEKELLRFVELEERRDSLVADLCGGMRRRVSLVCSLLHRPELVFLDEPTWAWTRS